MNAEQLQRVIGYAEVGLAEISIDPVTSDPDFVAANADLAAMRQPITAHSLLASGWLLKGWRWWHNGGDRFSLYLSPDDSRWEFSIGRIGMTTIATTSNMYDLDELVRLLGGENA